MKKVKLSKREKYEKKQLNKLGKITKNESKKETKLQKKALRKQENEMAKTMEYRKKSIFPFSKGEDVFSAIVHIVGAVFAIVASVFMLLKASGARELISVIIFGISMTLLYTMSAIYHFLHRNNAKKVFRIFDQCSIFLLIAGTYTPFTLITFKDNIVGLVMFLIVWIVSIVGISLNAINMTKKPVIVFTQIAYIVLGWLVIFAISPLIKAIEIEGFLWLLAGGVFYTAGVAFFGLSRKVRYFHPIWHMMVLFGSLAHFVSVYLYVL